METDVLEVKENSHIKNLGYITLLKDIYSGDPFKGDINGFIRNSIAHKAYKIRKKAEYDPEDSFRAASEAIKSRLNSKDFVNLFACPQCELCFVHPKRYLIHFKWHSFGLKNENWCISEVTSLNADFLVKKMAYYCFCSGTFSTIKELGDHVKESHGLPKLNLLAQNEPTVNDPTCTEDISNGLAEKKKTRRLKVSSKAESTSVSSREKRKRVKVITKPIQKSMKKKGTQTYEKVAQKNKKIDEKSKSHFKTKRKHVRKPEMGEEVLVTTNKRKRYNAIENETVESRKERIRLRAREYRRKETEEKRIVRLEKKRAYKIKYLQMKAEQLLLIKNRTKRSPNETEKHYLARINKIRINERKKKMDEKRDITIEDIRRKGRERARERLLNETEEEREARLDHRRAYYKKISLLETQEQKKARLEKMRIQRLSNETEEEYKARMEKLRNIHYRNNENKRKQTKEKKRKRYEKMKIRKHERLEAETEEQRRARLDKDLNRRLAKIQNETEEETIARLNRQNTYARAKIQNETEEQKIARKEKSKVYCHRYYQRKKEKLGVEKMREYYRGFLRNETREHRMARLEKRRIYKWERQQKKTKGQNDAENHDSSHLQRERVRTRSKKINESKSEI